MTAEHLHCWHETGIILTSNPPQKQYVCCFCRATISQATYSGKTLPWKDIEKHGKYLPSYTYPGMMTKQHEN